MKHDNAGETQKPIQNVITNPKSTGNHSPVQNVVSRSKEQGQQQIPNTISGPKK